MTTVRETLDARLSRVEFTMMISMVMAVVALAIDMMLPAFGEMRIHFGLAEDSNALAPVVTFFFIGLALGQPFWGPVSDAVGRKRVLYAGLALYVVAAMGAALAPSIGWLFVARFIGGLGAAGPRVVAQSIVRDAFEGKAMAQILSYIMAVFLLVPILAPSIGAGLLLVGSWKLVFIAIGVFGVAMGLWTRRLPETLAPERRIPPRPSKLGAAWLAVMRNRFAMGLTLAQTVLFGFFASYLASSQLFIDDVFGLGDWFPLIFAAGALMTATGMLVNPRLIDRVSIRTILRGVFVTYMLGTAAMTLLVALTGGHPPFWAYMVSLAPILFAHALLIPNLNAAALFPMGDVAGTAAAVIGTVSTLGGALIGASIDRAYDGTLLPWAMAGAAASVAALAFFLWADRVWDSATSPEGRVTVGH